MDINKIIEDEIREELKEFMNRYKHKNYLTSKEAATELGLGTGDNLRKQMDKFSDLYIKEGTVKKPIYRWVKFSLAKFIFERKMPKSKTA